MSDATKKPSHIAYTVREGKNGKNYWTPLGAVFPHGYGGGFTVDVTAIPLDGKLVCLPPKEKPEGEETPKRD